MNDQPLRIPPQQIGPVGPAGPSKPAAPNAPQPGFENQLKEAMGKVSQNVEELESAKPSNVDDLKSTMDAAKTAFSDTMRMHQLMKTLVDESKPSDGGSNEGS